MAETILDYWKRMIYRAVETPQLCFAGTRKIVLDFAIDIPGSVLLAPSPIDYDTLNYSTRVKHRQLERNYWDYDAVAAAVEKLKKRAYMPHSSVAIQLHARAKDSRSQGFCMQNLVIVVTPKYSEVIIYYRSTEIIQKFMADLIFFSRQLKPIFEELNIQPAWFRFRFANAYLSATFIPLFVRIDDQPATFFRHMELHDPRFFRTCSRSVLTHANLNTVSKFRSRTSLLRYWRKHMDEERITPLVRYLNRRRKIQGCLP